MEADDELLVRSRVTPAAFEPLVERLGPAVHAYLARRAPYAADELLADVWLAALRVGARSIPTAVLPGPGSSG
ncbi:hypothetical protein GCM10009804_60780 [Kribbella hippodromi]|uniref:RNA polymerase sigma-70 region 2 domain-containing protein n=1 Tax=Kribbella hippodromi TaxID=434347 RepID=A0ABP4Q310_9ACTN